MVFVRFRAPGDQDWRLGMAVTKKVGTAVARNRAKRVLREFFRLHQFLLPPSVDIVVIPKRGFDPKRTCLADATRDLLPLLEPLRSFATRAAEEGA